MRYMNLDDSDDLPAFERTHNPHPRNTRIDRSKPRGKRPWRGCRSFRSL